MRSLVCTGRLWVMLNDLVLGRIALWSGGLMLFGVVSDRSSWARASFKSPDTTTDAAVYNIVASGSGVVALIALAVALNTRPRVVLPILSLLPALAAFGLSIFVSGLGVWARLQGEIWLYAAGAFAGDLGEEWVAHPARGPFLFTFLAALGALATLGLMLAWLRDAHRARGGPSRTPVSGAARGSAFISSSVAWGLSRGDHGATVLPRQE